MFRIQSESTLFIHTSLIFPRYTASRTALASPPGASMAVSYCRLAALNCAAAEGSSTTTPLHLTSSDHTFFCPTGGRKTEQGDLVRAARARPSQGGGVHTCTAAVKGMLASLLAGAAVAVAVAVRLLTSFHLKKGHIDSLTLHSNKYRRNHNVNLGEAGQDGTVKAQLLKRWPRQTCRVHVSIAR